MTKKKIITIILSVTGTLLILGITAGVLLSPYLFGVGFKKVLNCKPEEITEIQLSNGNVGVGTVVTDPEEIKEIFKLFDDVRVKKVPVQAFRQRHHIVGNISQQEHAILFADAQRLL